MAKKPKKPRGSNDSALSAFKALEHVIAQTEKGIEKKQVPKKSR